MGFDGLEMGAGGGVRKPGRARESSSECLQFQPTSQSQSQSAALPPLSRPLPRIPPPIPSQDPLFLSFRSPPPLPQPPRAPSPISMPIPVSYACMSPIHSLPVELLTRIFQLGVDSDPLPDDQYPGEPTFEVLVSHVCRHWRQIAIHTPHLWTTIHFRTRAHMVRGETYLSRNGHLPIDIYVDTCSEDDYKERKDLLFREQFLPVFDVVLPHINRWRELHLKVADLECKSFARRVLSTCGTAPALQTLQLWHVQNWRTSERLYNHIGPPPVVVFGGSLPSLKHIILQGVNLPWSRSPFLRDLTSIEFALHSDNVRMPFDLWREMLDSSPNLTRLSLLFAGPRAAPSGTSPLPDGIEWWGAEPPPPDAVVPPGAPLPPSVDPIQLPQLRELQLNNLESDYLIALFRTLHAPGVRALHLGLDFDDQDATPFMEYLAAPPRHPAAKLRGPSDGSSSNGSSNGAGGAPCPKFPALERLSVSALKCSVPSWRALLAASRKVTRLEVDFAQLSEGAFDVLLECIPSLPDSDSEKGDVALRENGASDDAKVNGKGKGKARATDADAGSDSDDSRDSPNPTSTHANGTSSPSPSSSSSTPMVPILPLLSSIRVSGVSGAQLAHLAAFRRAHGRALRRWEVDECARDEDAEALERAMAARSAAWRAAREAEERAAGRACQPWRWDEPLERLVWFREEEECGSEYDEEDEEEYAEEDGEGEDGEG
ncbi:hypothetical protein OH77DRAFT_93605 [Trametes cingulata]|nr:hypothetical protein OH77DRAFT_93605 [Trametes cingulata]